MTFRRKRLVHGVLLATLWLSGCATVGPDFTPPSTPTDSGYAAPGDRGGADAELVSGDATAGPWWKALRSADLDDVMKRAIANNQTIAVARETLAKARSEVQHERAALAPTVTAGASYQRERINIAALGFPGFPSPTLGLYSVGPSVSYDLDLVGGSRRRLEAARASVEAEASRADAAYLTLTGNVALAAVTIASLRAQLAAVEAVIADDRQSLEILRRAEMAGGNAPSATVGGKLQLDQDLALTPAIQQQLELARHALALLVGETPSHWSAPDFAMEDFIPPSKIPVALPSRLVKDRPDIRAAEAILHADTAIVGVETARLYPDVRLVAGLNQEALSPGALFNFGAMAYDFGPQISVPIFDAGGIRADRRGAQAQARASLAQYRQTVIFAFTQVADVLSALGQDDEQLHTLQVTEAHARSALDEARSAYRLGGAPLSTVVAADRVWRRTVLTTAGVAGQRLKDIVALYAATAADWQSSDANGPPSEATASH